MIPIYLTILCAFYGAYRAKRLGGNRLDQLQFAAGFALAGFTIGTIIGLLADHFLR